MIDKNYFIAILFIAMGGFTIAMTFKQKSRTFIFGGSAVIAFVIGTIFVEAGFGVALAVVSPLITFLFQKVIKPYKKGIDAGKSLRETFSGMVSEASGFSKTPAQFVEEYNSEVDDYAEMATEPEEGSHRKRKQVDCSALKIVKTVEQTPNSGYFQLQDAPYIKIHWIKGQYDEQLKGVAFAMKVVQQLGADFDAAATLWPEIRYGEGEDETISIPFAVIKSMIHALYDYSKGGAALRVAVSTLAKHDIDPEDLGWTKVWKFQCEVNEYASKALAKVNVENRERFLTALEAAQNETKAAQEIPETLSAESREEFEFEGVSFVVIVSNQLSSMESESTVRIVASKDAGIERRLESEISSDNVHRHEHRPSAASNNSNATNFDISREEFISNYNKALRDDRLSIMKTAQEQDNFSIDPAAVYEDDSETEKVVHFKLPEQSVHLGCIEDDNRIKAVLIESEESSKQGLPAEALIYTILAVLYKNNSDYFRIKRSDFIKGVSVYNKQLLAELLAEIKSELAASLVTEKSAYKRFEFEGSWLCVKLTASYDIPNHTCSLAQALMLTKDLSLEKLLTGEQS